MKVNAKVVGYGPDPETTKALVNIIVEFSGPTETMTLTVIVPNGRRSRTHCAIPMASLLRRSSVRGHRSEIMFGVLVVVFCPDYVAALGFSLGERQIPFIVSSRVVRAVLFGAGGIR